MALQIRQAVLVASTCNFTVPWSMPGTGIMKNTHRIGNNMTRAVWRPAVYNTAP